MSALIPRRRAFALLLFVPLLSACPAGAAPVTVSPTIETAPVTHSGDAADDPALWIHPSDPSLSTIIGTDKADGGGLAVYDLAGQQLQFVVAGRLNNVDLRYAFPLGTSRVALVGATNRSTGSIDFFRVDPTDRSLARVGSVRTSPPISMPYGFSLYRSPVSGRYYAFVTRSGRTAQWELDGTTGSVTATLVRRVLLPSATEGLVADDELGRLYVGEETRGVWRYGAEPGDASPPVSVDSTTALGGNLVADVEGLTLYYGTGGAGYLIAASQGDSSFHVYRRGDNAHLGAFTIVAGNGIDRVTGQDGIDVTNFPLGAAFPQGAFVSQDDSNDGFRQNFKAVPWQAIAAAFAPPLTIDTAFDPRTVGGGGPPPPPPPDDVEPPETSIDSGPSGTTALTSASFTFSSTEPGSVFACSLDGPTFSPCTSPASFGGLARGSHTFQVRATDAAGNVDLSPAARTWDVQPPATSVHRFAPEADAYVQAARPTTNAGTSTTLLADGSPVLHSYLRFVVAGLDGAVQSAKLRLYVTDGSVNGPAVQLTSNAWTEGGIVWNGRPAPIGAAADDKGALSTGTWAEFDVTPLVSGDGPVSFALVPTSSDGTDLRAREASSNRPELVVTAGTG